MQDNAWAHSACLAQEYLSYVDIMVMQWSARSLVIKSTEYIWYFKKKHKIQNALSYDLGIALHEWQNMLQETINDVIRGMPWRI